MILNCNGYDRKEDTEAINASGRKLYHRHRVLNKTKMKCTLLERWKKEVFVKGIKINKQLLEVDIFGQVMSAFSQLFV